MIIEVYILTLQSSQLTFLIETGELGSYSVVRLTTVALRMSIYYIYVLKSEFPFPAD